MMFLDFLDSEEGRKYFKVRQAETTYPRYYQYWRDILFSDVMHLFEWKGMDDVMEKEIELRLIIQGNCAITKILNEQELTAMFGNYYGVAKYFDEQPYYTVRCPVYSGQRKVGVDVAVINNNKLRNPTYEIVHHYSTLLAHTEVTMINSLVSARDSGGAPVARTEKSRASIEQYQSQVYNGRYGVILDSSMVGVEYAGTDRHTMQKITDINVVKERLLKDFYSKIGLKTGFEKRANIVTEELTADNAFLSFNLDDMLESRKRGCEKVNELYGTNWSVELSEQVANLEDEAKFTKEQEEGEQNVE
jgi:hypothetical protein